MTIALDAKVYFGQLIPLTKDRMHLADSRPYTIRIIFFFLPKMHFLEPDNLLRKFPLVFDKLSFIIRVYFGSVYLSWGND